MAVAPFMGILNNPMIPKFNAMGNKLGKMLKSDRGNDPSIRKMIKRMTMIDIARL
jgi:hypothetical protein